MKPKFTVRLTPRFSREIKSLDRKPQIQILREITVLETNPYAGKPLHGEFKGVFSLRAGTYRVLYKIKENQILILAVGHRKNIYE